MAVPRPRQPPTTITVNLAVRYFSAGHGLSGFPCLSCDNSLDFHQPDPDLPQRMLGTCDACKSWHLLNFVADGPGAVLTLLPEEGPFSPNSLG